MLSPSFSMCASTSFLVGARPLGVLSCLRRFWVDSMPFVKATEMSPKSSVTRNAFVWIAAPHTNSGIGVPLYLPGCVVDEGGTAGRPWPGRPTGTISYFALKSGGRVALVLRLFRSVRSRQENFWIGQTLVSCSSQSGFDCVSKATHVGRIRQIGRASCRERG